MAVTGVALGDPVRLMVPCGGLRPAPSVTGHSALVARPAGSTAAPGPIPPAAAAAVDTRRSMVAGLLIAACVVLAGGAAFGRRRRAVDDGPKEAGDDDASEESEPRLTLVRVPNEGGP